MHRLLKPVLFSLSALLLAGSAAASAAEEAGKAPTDTRYVLFDTTDGEILIELYPDKAPLTVVNFVKYVKDGFYDKTTFHRVIKDFVVQGGGYTPEFEEKETRKPVRNESRDAKLRNLRGTIAMARSNDPHSATSQFYFNLKDNTGLDWDGMHGGYTVFGRVVKGLDVVDDIASIPTGPGPEDAEVFIDRDVPFRPVYIRSARVVSNEEAAGMLEAEAPTSDATEGGSK